MNLSNLLFRPEQGREIPVKVTILALNLCLLNLTIWLFTTWLRLRRSQNEFRGNKLRYGRQYIAEVLKQTSFRSHHNKELFNFAHNFFIFALAHQGDELQYQNQKTMSLATLGGREHESRAGLGVQPPGGLRGAKPPHEFAIFLASTYRKRSLPLPPPSIASHSKSVSSPRLSAKIKKFNAKLKNSLLLMAEGFLLSFQLKNSQLRRTRNAEK